MITARTANCDHVKCCEGCEGWYYEYTFSDGTEERDMLMQYLKSYCFEVSWLSASFGLCLQCEYFQLSVIQIAPLVQHHHVAVSLQAVIL